MCVCVYVHVMRASSSFHHWKDCKPSCTCAFDSRVCLHFICAFSNPLCFDDLRVFQFVLLQICFEYLQYVNSLCTSSLPCQMTRLCLRWPVCQTTFFICRVWSVVRDDTKVRLKLSVAAGFIKLIQNGSTDAQSCCKFLYSFVSIGDRQLQNTNGWPILEISCSATVNRVSVFLLIDLMTFYKLVSYWLLKHLKRARLRKCSDHNSDVELLFFSASVLE